MARIYLGAYALRVRRLRAREYESIRMGEEGVDLTSFFFQYAEILADLSSRNELSQSILQARSVSRSDSEVWGHVQSGDYGYTAELVDAESGRHTYDREANEAELLPFFFLLRAQSGAKVGVIVLQRYGQYGVKAEFIDAAKERFREEFPEFIMDVNRLVPQAVIEALQESSLVQVDVISHTIPSDIADLVRLRGSIEEEGYFVSSIKARRNQRFSMPRWIARILAGQAGLHERIGDQATNVKVTVDFNGKRRKIDLQHPGSVTPHIDVTDDVEIDETGHPSLDSILSASRRLVSDLEAQLGIVEND